eukprot:SAG25_NODE_3_length_30426_cov_8.268210_10_plen_96_part_00
MRDRSPQCLALEVQVLFSVPLQNPCYFPRASSQALPLWRQGGQGMMMPLLHGDAGSAPPPPPAAAAGSAGVAPAAVAVGSACGGGAGAGWATMWR